MDPGRTRRPAEHSEVAPRVASLPDELERTLAEVSGCTALWVGLGDGRTLVTLAQDPEAAARLMQGAASVMGTCHVAPPDGDSQVVLMGPDEVVVTLSVDEEVRLLASFPPHRLLPGDVDRLRAAARRIEAQVGAWKARVATGRFGSA